MRKNLSRLIPILSLIFLAVTQSGAIQLPPDSSYRRLPGFVSANGPYRPAAPRTTDIIHTSLQLFFDWEKQEVKGHAILMIKPHFYPQDSVILDARAFQMGAIQLVRGLPQQANDFKILAGTPLSYTYDQYQIKIALGKTYSRQDTLYLSIRYTARPIDAEKLVFGGAPVERGLYFINPDRKNPYKPRQLWTQGETTGGSSWFPTIEAPNERFTQDIYLTVEEKQRSVSNGRLISQTLHSDGTRTDHWNQNLPHPPYLTAIAVGDFVKVEDKTFDDLEVSYYVDSSYAPYARKIFGRTPEMITFFSKLFGVPYPWEKYSQVVVHDFISGAMENTTMTILQEETQMTDRELLDGDSDALIAHELVHHWFGNLVTCEEWGQLPLNESFANYAEYLWEEHKSGRAAADWSGYLELGRYLSESRSKQVEMIRYFYEHPDQMFDSHSYAKGGRILHMLRYLVGDEAFFSSLNLYLKNKRFGTAELADLRIAFEEVTGLDLNWFFDQWFYKPGHPELTVSHHFLPAPGKLMLQVKQSQDLTRSTVYRLPLKIGIWVKGQKILKEIVIDQAEQEFAFTLPAAPDLVLFDVDCQLLGTITHDKDKAEWLYQLKHSESFLARFKALQQLASYIDDKQVREAHLALLDDPFWKIRQEAVYNLASIEGNHQPEFESFLLKLAKNDPNPQVRGEALLALDALKGNKYLKEYLQALNDSSYAVAATAIGLLKKNQYKSIGSVVSRFKNLPNEYIAAAVGDYYGDLASPEYFGWFTEMFQQLSPSGSYVLLQAFGKYLIKSEKSVQEKGLVTLEEMARHNRATAVRYGAYQLMSWFDDLPGMKELLINIRENERNHELLDLYKAINDK